MSITDELREWAHGFNGPWKRNEEMLLAIADRIDAEHEAKVSYWQGASYKDGYDEGFASADDWLGQHEDAMAEHGWVKLPVDADGVPWYRGSQVIDPKDPDGNVKTVWIAGDNTLITDDHLFIFHANELRHHHAPTVEDKLWELIDALGIDRDKCSPVMVENAARELQLREEA